MSMNNGAVAPASSRAPAGSANIPGSTKPFPEQPVPAARQDHWFFDVTVDGTHQG